ncbi:hypothetical protein KKE92_01320 [Candidatus Micrarchaeota archaeon]|nr:hypothetical protein [Candidatus Micrarchaeota archaeon]MBU1681792.1 hypothetical protein [Candidatus Micrarchaeota archaeon]
MKLVPVKIKRITVRTRDNDPNLMNIIFGVGMRRLIVGVASKFKVRGYVSNLYGRNRPRVEFIFEDLEPSVADTIRTGIERKIHSKGYDYLKAEEKTEISVSLEACNFEESDFRTPPHLMLENEIKETAWQLDGARRLFDAQEKRRRRALLCKLQNTLGKLNESADENPVKGLDDLREQFLDIAANFEMRDDPFIIEINELLALLRDTSGNRNNKIRDKIGEIVSKLEEEINT